MRGFSRAHRQLKPSQNVKVNTSVPINEFGDNKEFFMHGFPHLFLLGQGQPTGGSVQSKLARLWLLQFDGRFAQSMPLLFALFNQLQRHAACRKTALRVKAGATGVGKFVELANDAAFRERLERAVAQPKSADARSIAMTIMRCVRACVCLFA